MRSEPQGKSKNTTPQFLKQANEIAKYMKTLNETEIAKVMKISSELSNKTRSLLRSWNSSSAKQSPAIDSFLGDIYSGLQAHDLNSQDRKFAQKHLRIISGLYGMLKPLDGIYPYRLEMAYKLPDQRYRNLYSFWGETLANTIVGEDILNLSSVEYSKVLLPYIKGVKVVTPKFLSVNPKSKEPGFVVVHAKIARGACAHWLIKNRVQNFSELRYFDAIGYQYSKKLSTKLEPVFVAKEFGGLGLSVRLS